MIHPLLYEINTRCWLRSLSGRTGKKITLATVPDAAIKRLTRLGFTHVWAMGVWTTGVRGRTHALENADLRAAFEKVLPGWTKDDVSGSPYAITDYKVPSYIGGDDGLKVFREKLNRAGIKLLLDFVPNHVGMDHPWVAQRPEMFVQGPAETPGTFEQQMAMGPRWIAHGKDPYFGPWTDTAQLDYRRRETHAAMTHELESIARRCDGVRCDMAMLVMSEVFSKTWAHLPQPLPPPAHGFWARCIPMVRRENRDFVFLAEVYWGMEAKLQALGFDYTYNKSFYDLLREGKYPDLRRNLIRCPDEQLAASAHFLENHDEPRSASVFPPEKLRAAALLLLSLPGMRMIYEGQIEGRRVQTPVQLGRWPDEPVDAKVQAMYEELFAALKKSAVGNGEFRILRAFGWPDNESARKFIIVQWQSNAGEFDLVVINLGSERGQCRVRPGVDGIGARDWEMRDRLSAETHRAIGREIEAEGVYFELPGNGAQVFHFRPSPAKTKARVQKN